MDPKIIFDVGAASGSSFDITQVITSIVAIGAFVVSVVGVSSRNGKIVR